MPGIKPVCILRCDGGSAIGLGHVYRCLAIAERTKDDFEFYIAIQEPEEAIRKLAAPFAQIVALPKTDDYYDEAMQLLSLASQLSCKLIILDGYHFDTRYQQKLREGKLKIASIDDYAPFHYVADAIINHSDGIETNDISAEAYTKKYLGFDYALLRKRFIDLYETSREINKMATAFICFGGADPNNITKKVCKAVLDSSVFTRINVVTGSSYQHIEELSQYTSGYASVFLYENLMADQLVEVMLSSDIAFVPASTIAMECFAAHLVLFTGTTAENQRYIYRGLLKKKFVNDLGDINCISEQGIIESIKAAARNFVSHNFKGQKRDDHLRQVLTSLV
jgi:UDP-2,4-diacetamido-2,4,6-trideoxy-beta-L-altropyranose hydrolase